MRILFATAIALALAASPVQAAAPVPVMKVNPGNGRVMNNAMVVGDQPALYAFNKCMIANGFPLK